MATIAQVRRRSEDLFAQLLAVQTTEPRRPRARGLRAAQPVERFSWFDPEQAVKAAALAFRLCALAASATEGADGLGAALDHVEERMEQADPEEVRQGFALFTTHNRDGRRLTKPRTVAAAPGLFNPPGPRRRGARRFSVSIGGASPGLDYWREDVLANEHHQHWHEVYPYTGLPPRSFPDWLAERTEDELVAILDLIAPGRDWPALLAGATPEQVAGLFAQVVEHSRVRLLPPDLYRLLFRPNDRQGELFFYMHQQMLARYDAELLSNGLVRVTPFGPPEWRQPISAGHDPIGVPGFSRRDENLTLADEHADLLEAIVQAIDDALQSNSLRAVGGGTVDIDRTNIGEAVEATIAQLQTLDADAYPGLHNLGHGVLAALSEPEQGVMRSTVTAIRDQVFWQWHKFIDDVNARWQDTLAPYDFGDAPDVLVRNGLDDETAAWASPDIILCRTADLPPGANPAELGEQLFGGDSWSTDFTAREASAGGTTLTTLAELVTTMATVNFGGNAIRYLTHEPFSYFVRIENEADAALDVTLRVFLAPAEQAQDRRLWMEMDKFVVSLPAGARVVAYRPDTESSVIKRPSETSPVGVLAGGGDPDENAYCDCGWPYTLLLPRGTPAGLAYRLLVMCTDAAIDQVAAPDRCGSMSYCGAVDRYPDTRDMGYPFSRPFAGPEADAIRDTIVVLANAAARTVSIRHV